MKKSWIARTDDDVFSSRVNGTDGDDYFAGYDYGDVYHGRGGDDLVDGNGGSDRLIGGKGHDDIYGEKGQDRLFGGPGYDLLVGGEHRDILTGGSEADEFRFLAWPSYGGVSHLDIITDFDPREVGEYISMNLEPELGITKFSQLRDMMVQDGDDVVLSFGGVDMLVLEDVRIRQLGADDLIIVT